MAGAWGEGEAAPRVVCGVWCVCVCVYVCVVCVFGVCVRGGRGGAAPRPYATCRLVHPGCCWGSVMSGVACASWRRQVTSVLKLVPKGARRLDRQWRSAHTHTNTHTHEQTNTRTHHGRPLCRLDSIAGCVLQAKDSSGEEHCSAAAAAGPPTLSVWGLPQRIHCRGPSHSQQSHSTVATTTRL